MFNKFRANALAKKTAIFVTVFALTCILLGNKLNSMSGEKELIAATKLLQPAGQAIETSYQCAVANSSAQQEGENMPPDIIYLTEWPYTGEYPEVTANPLPLQPLIETRSAVAGGFVYCTQIPLSLELQQYTYTRCVEFGLEYELVLALMWRESRFTIDAVNTNTNGTQDSGIMQINDVNRGWLEERYGITDLMDPIQNIDAGTIMLNMFIDKYGVHNGLMAYQYGEQGMQQKISQGVVTNRQISILIDKRDDYREMLRTL